MSNDFTLFVWGGRPRPRRTPWSGSCFFVAHACGARFSVPCRDFPVFGSVPDISHFFQNRDGQGAGRATFANQY
jgi:hypothetical protein